MLIMLQYSIPKPFESTSLRFKRDIELTIPYHKEPCLHNKNCELCILLKSVRLTLKFDWSLEMHF